jgi:hypothetical protein
MLDNVVEVNGLPLEQQRIEIMRKRRHGMGFLGLGSTMTMLRMKYGSPESCEFTEAVSREMAVAGWEVALALAEEKGPAPIMDEDFTVTAEMLRKRPEMAKDGFKVGDAIKGRLLHAKYSRYMQRVAGVAPELVQKLAETGARFTHHSSIAPTGTISLSLANNASNGIEPSFAHHYSRNVIREGKKSKEKVDVYSFELLAYRELVNPKAMPYSDDPEAKLPDYFIAADDISPKEHVDIQAASQIWIDSSISKTANVPTDFPYEDFKDIYRYAHEKGLKGCTTFRFNPAAFQGVLVKEAMLIYESRIAAKQNNSKSSAQTMVVDPVHIFSDSDAEEKSNSSANPNNKKPKQNRIAAFHKSSLQGSAEDLAKTSIDDSGVYNDLFVGKPKALLEELALTPAEMSWIAMSREFRYATDGKNGSDGKDGQNGGAGKAGGADGLDGVDGADGVQGSNADSMAVSFVSVPNQNVFVVAPNSADPIVLPLFDADVTIKLSAKGGDGGNGGKGGRGGNGAIGIDGTDATADQPGVDGSAGKCFP